MKKVFGRIVSEILYLLGDWVSYPMAYLDWGWLYPTYSKLMGWSGDVQDWAGNDKPWSKVKN